MQYIGSISRNYCQQEVHALAIASELTFERFAQDLMLLAWKEYKTQEGRVYYHDSVNSHSQWIAPPGYLQAKQLRDHKVESWTSIFITYG